MRQYRAIANLKTPGTWMLGGVRQQGTNWMNSEQEARDLAQTYVEINNGRPGHSSDEYEIIVQEREV